jgi:hypothetical protein
VVLEAPREIPRTRVVPTRAHLEKADQRSSWGTRPDWQQLGIAPYVAASQQPAWLAIPGDVRLTSLPGRCLRLELVGARWRTASPRLLFLGSGCELTHARGRLAGVVKLPRLPLVEPLVVAERDSSRGLGTPPLHLSAATNGAADSVAGFRWEIPRDGLFEPAVFVAETRPHFQGTGELVPVSPVYALHPDDLPLRAPLIVRLDSPAKRLPDRLGLYRDSGDGWEFVRSRYDSTARRVEGESRRLGRFALFRDVRAPHITRQSPPRQASDGPYRRWALEARLADHGSGIDARASYFEIDGRRAASEWDDDQNTLRWRPVRSPARGRHAYRVIAADRAGNIARSSGTFVLD